MNKKPIFDISEIETSIGVPAVEWEGRCHEISCLIVKTGSIGGEAVYGHYTGYIKKGTLFSGKRLIRHGWIVKDDIIVDPTRWVFEGVKPYIFVGEAKAHPEYDRGGERFRKALESVNYHPKPDFDPNTTVFHLESEDDRILFSLILESETLVTSISMNQLFWVANRPMSTLGDSMLPIYEWLCKKHLKTLIPIDYYKIAFPEGK